MQKKDRFLDYLIELPNYLSIFITPVYFMTISPMLIEMSKETGFSSENLSLIFTFFTIGLIAGQLTSIIYNRFLKRVVIITAGYILQIILLISLSFVRDLYLFYILYALLGYIAGIIWIQATNYILESNIINKARLTTIAFSFYPVGNFTAPFIASNLVVRNLNWRYSYYITALIALIILFLYFFIKKMIKRKSIINEKTEKISFKEVFTNKQINFIFILICILLLFYVISETVIATWSPTFLRKIRFFDIDEASLAVSVFWMSILAGRIIISAIAGKIKSNFIMLVLSIVGMISISFFVKAHSLIFIFITMVLTGLGCSGMITLSIADASMLYEKGKGLLASIVFAVINLGTSITPFITKSISRLSLSWSIGVASIFMFLTFLTIAIKIIYEKKITRVDEPTV